MSKGTRQRTYAQVITQHERTIAKLTREKEALQRRVNGLAGAERTAIDRMHEALVRQRAALADDVQEAYRQSAALLDERLRREHDLYKLKLELSAEMEDELRSFHARRRALTAEYRAHRAQLKAEFAKYTEQLEQQFRELQASMQAQYATRWQRRTEAALARVSLHQRPAFCPESVRDGEIITYAPTLTPVIYGLVTLEAPTQVRYVGQARRPFHRWLTHTGKHPDVPRVGEWIATSRERGETPAMLCLERCDLSDLDVRESHWIYHFLALGMADLNSNIPSRYPTRLSS